jgi:hypothetical protein
MDLKVAATQKLHESASTAARARRGVFNATASGAANQIGDHDLVSDVASGRVDLAAVPAAELPPAIAGLPVDQQRQFVEATAEQRASLQKRIIGLAGQRDEFIADKLEEVGGAADSLDRQIYDAVRAQAAPKGLSYETGPKY